MMNKKDVKDYSFIPVSGSVFSVLSKQELGQIPVENQQQIFKRGSILYNQGNKINGFYYVFDGVIKIFKTGFDGKEQIIRFARKGDIMGFRSTINHENACTTAKVIEDAQILFIHGDLILELIRNNGNFALHILQVVCKELGEANEFITDIAQKTVRERLAEVLIHLKNEFEADMEGYLNISLTREEIANLVGTATESVIRLLSEFKQDGLIEIKGRKLKIIDEKKLYKIANLML